MGWSIDQICWNIIRGKILKERYAGVVYDALDSNSAIIIRHRGILSGKSMKKIANLFPRHIRVEFQEVKYEGEETQVIGEHHLHQDHILCECGAQMYFKGTQYSQIDGKEISVYSCTACSKSLQLRIIR